MNNPGQDGSNNGGYGGTGSGSTATNAVNQQNFQAQLVQQLSQQLSQSMGQKLPQGNLQALLASMQSQLQNTQPQPPPPPPPPPPPQQQLQLPPELLALARSGNFAGFNALANGTQQQPSAPMAGPPLAAAANHTQQLALPISNTNMGAPTPSATMPVAKDSSHNTNSLVQQHHKPAAPPSLGNVGEVRAGFQGRPSTATTSRGNVTSDAAKDERRKAPGSVIVPCRARGMPMDHNFKTAYFVIPENVRHGEELICSYFACRNAGVKFRYCSHCKVPVAKRNFRKRHKHGDNMGKDGASGEDDDDNSAIEEDGCSDEGESPGMPPSHSHQGVVPSQVTTGRSNNRREAIPSQVTTTTKANDGGERSSKKKKSSSHIPSQVTTSSSNNGDGSNKMKSQSKKSSNAKGAGALENASVCMRSGDDRSKVIKCRRGRWATLLEKRPQTKDGEAMSSWLMQVLAVSDLWKPLNESEKMPNASLDLIRECAQAGTENKKKKASRSARKEKRRSSNGNGSGSSDSQHSQESANNQDDHASKNSYNDSDNQERMSPNGQEKRMLLKKRPVVEPNTDESGDKPEEPSTSKPRLETETVKK